MLGRTWFGSEVRSVFWGSVGSRFGFWRHTEGSGGSRFSYEVRRTFLNLFDVNYSQTWGFMEGRIFCKTVGVNFWTCFSLKRRRHFSQNQIFQYCLKKLAKILLNGCRKSKFSKILKVRGSVLEGSVWFWKYKPRFGRFEVRFSRGSEVRGSEFLGSTQD